MPDWVEFSVAVDGQTQTCGLPGVLAHLTAGRDVVFRAARPHQAGPLRAFWVALAIQALEHSDLGLDGQDEGQWLDLLTAWIEAQRPGASASAFALVAPADAPAFFQAPAQDWPGGFKTLVETPDALDMLITSKNHDIKAARMRDAGGEDWALALMSLQTQEGFLGRGNYGIARMNGGFGSRPFVWLRVSQNAGLQFRRDVQRLLARHKDSKNRIDDVFTGELGLTWLRAWDGASQLAVDDLHPLCLEICRRVRLVKNEEGRIVAHVGSSSATRIAMGDEHKGATGDPWTPISVLDQKSLSITGEGYSWRRINKLLFGQGKDAWALPPLARAHKSDGAGPFDLVFEGVARGQGKTEGFHQRVLPVPPHAGVVLHDEAGMAQVELAEAARLHEDDAANMARQVLRRGLMAAFTKGPALEDLKLDAKEAGSAADQILQEQFDPFVDASFFDALFGTPEQTPDERRIAWQSRLAEHARSVLDSALSSGPRTDERRWKAEARGIAAFEASLFKRFPDLRPTKSIDRDPKEAGDDSH